MSLVSTVIGVIVVLAMLYVILSYYFMKTANLTSLEDATEEQVILATNISSDNHSSNYTYSMWFYVEDWNYRFGYQKILLSKTSESIPIQQVVLGDVMNNVKVYIGCYSDSSDGVIEHECVVRNFPLQSWVNLTISVYGRTLDVYMDGKLVKTCLLPGVAKTSPTDNILVTPDGGFSGWTSNIKYWGDASNPQEVYNIYKDGYGGNILGNMSNKYSLKFSFMENNKEKTSYEF
jgi:hypothetical protein